MTIAMYENFLFLAWIVWDIASLLRAVVPLQSR